MVEVRTWRGSRALPKRLDKAILMGTEQEAAFSYVNQNLEYFKQVVEAGEVLICPPEEIEELG
ncbi:hypothetical protein CDL15_Pgr001549 [Punica granatum]|uniref:Uncharacterized protein n=1 Tax=Punica granatum TaxID=22663 RepID=A0A218X5C7_PUNGR|nr:hypothetical protein CDL15_Pgr001549 [Punica granatum]